MAGKRSADLNVAQFQFHFFKIKYLLLFQALGACGSGCFPSLHHFVAMVHQCHFDAQRHFAAIMLFKYVFQDVSLQRDLVRLRGCLIEQE